MVTIEGTVEEIIFSNESNGFTVCDITSEENITTAVGYMPYLSVGETIKITGKWAMHSDYGEQLKVEYYEKVLPSSENMILKYLASGIIKGIREATARKIIDEFADKALDIIEHEPEKLANIKGISKSKAQKIGESFREQNSVRSIVMFLQQYGITPNYAVKAYKRFGSSAIDQIKKNPYILSQEIHGIGFKLADKIAINMGMDLRAPERIKSGTKHVLTYNGSAGGHTYLPREILVDLSAQLLEVTEEEIENAIIAMMIDKTVYVEKSEDAQAVYLSPFHYAEMGVAQHLSMLAAAPIEKRHQDLEGEIKEIEKTTGIVLAKQQKEAVRQSLETGVLVITGGPGTGKTTTINTIIQLMYRYKYNIALAAPTGRAAKRMSEMTGKEAKTIHRLLEIGYTDEEEQLQFAKDEDNPLEHDVVIIDETSMVDILLMNALLKALKPGTRLILVGDMDQLPSVGAGNVLADIISSDAILKIRLTEIFRQAQESMIIVNAHRINQGEYPMINEKDKDFYFMVRNVAGQIVDAIVDLCKNRLPVSYDVHPIHSIQVLTPMRKTPVGVMQLNKELQEALNPPTSTKKEKAFREIVYREGDKVMQIKNNYNMVWQKVGEEEEGTGVFNGDIGYIQKIDVTETMMEVLFDEEKLVRYDFNQLDELDLAYALTVHKSQGSEFPVVIMPMFQGAPMLMTRNLFYTAVTRAKQLVVLVGRQEMMHKMVDNNREIKRYSGLATKLCALSGVQEISGEIGISQIKMDAASYGR